MDSHRAGSRPVDHALALLAGVVERAPTARPILAEKSIWTIRIASQRRHDDSYARRLLKIGVVRRVPLRRAEMGIRQDLESLVAGSQRVGYSSSFIAVH